MTPRGETEASGYMDSAAGALDNIPSLPHTAPSLRNLDGCHALVASVVGIATARSVLLPGDPWAGKGLGPPAAGGVCPPQDFWGAVAPLSRPWALWVILWPVVTVLWVLRETGSLLCCPHTKSVISNWAGPHCPT